MTGRPRAEGEKKRTNYSSFPRVTAGFAVIHSLAFIFAAAATAAGGFLERNLGQRVATSVVAGVLLALSLLLLAAMVRFRKVEIVPMSKAREMNQWNKERRESVERRASLIAEAKASGCKDFSNIPEANVGWRPLILGNPLSVHRRVNIIELGSLTRWTEIRKMNRLVDEGAHAHLNRNAMELVRDEIERRGNEFIEDIHHGGHMLRRVVSNLSKRSSKTARSACSHENHLGAQAIELRDLESARALQSRHGKYSREGDAQQDTTGDTSFADAVSTMHGTTHEETDPRAVGGPRIDERGHVPQGSTSNAEDSEFEDIELGDGRGTPDPVTAPAPAPASAKSKSHNKQD